MKKRWLLLGAATPLTGVAALAVLPVLAFAALPSENGQVVCPPGEIPVAAPVVIPDAKTGATIKGLNKTQTDTIMGIVAAAKAEKVPIRGMVIAAATAWQESTLDHTLGEAESHLDSAGPFQQRRAWGPLADRQDPVKSATMFFTGGQQGQRGLLDVGGWEVMSLATAAQFVQGSADGSLYADDEPRATQHIKEALGGSVDPAPLAPPTPCKQDPDAVAPGAGGDVLAPCAEGKGEMAAMPGGKEAMICTIMPGMQVQTTIADNTMAMIAAAKTAGLSLGGSGWRSHQRQQELRVINNCPDVWTAPSSSCSPPTAIPGQSQHEYGLALDLTCNGGGIIGSRSSPCWLWLASNAAKYGFKPLDSEEWHWSVNGR